MNNITVIPNPRKDAELKVTGKVIETLKRFGARVFIEDKFKSYTFDGVTYYNEFPNTTELLIVVGGDGSVLDASVKAIEYDIAIVGVNLGKVGYLSEVEPDNVEILENLFSDAYNIEEKMLLKTTIKASGDVFEAERLAVNDVVISHDSYLGIADFSVCTQVGSVKYRADGLIVSTPAGSTAYSLSAGGPIVSHGIEAMVVTPVCPHSFFDRSIIFSPSDIIRIKNTGDDKLNVSIDGRHSMAMKPGEECTVDVSEKRLRVLTFKENNMFSTLFKKMRILEDIK